MFGKLFKSKIRRDKEFRDLVNNKAKEIADAHNNGKNFDIQKIATLEVNKTHELLSDLSGTSVFGSGNGNTKQPERFASAESAEKEIYQKLNENNFFSDIREMTLNTNKTGSGRGLIKNTIDLDKKFTVRSNKARTKNAMPFDNLIKAADNLKSILDNGGHIISYDLETLGGTNAFGHHDLDFITEISASAQHISKGKASMAEEFNTILGMTKEEADKLRSFVKNVDLNNMSNKDKVLMHRLNIYGNSKTTYERVGDTFEHRVTGSIDGKGIKLTKADAFKAIDMFEDIGKAQTDWVNKSGLAKDLTEYRKSYVSQVAELIAKGKGAKGKYDNYISTGYNTVNFDNPMFSRYLNKQVEFDYGRHYDAFQSNLYISEYEGRGSIIPKNLSKKFNRSFGMMQQEQLAGVTNLAIDNGTAAHIASEDEKTLARMLYQDFFDNGDSFFAGHTYKKLKNIEKEVSATTKTYTGPNKQVYLMNNTGQKDFASKQGSLSFAYDPISKNYKTFDGHEISENGITSSYNQYGPKANSLYTHQITEVEMNDDFKNIINEVAQSKGMDADKLMEEYSSVDKLYVVNSKAFYDKQAIKKRFGDNVALGTDYEYFSIFTNKEQAVQSLGTAIGEQSEGQLTKIYTDSVGALHMSAIEESKDKLVKKNLNKLSPEQKIEMLMDRSIDRTLNDPASRLWRQMSYGKMKKLRKFQKSSPEGVNGTVAKLISENKPLTLSLQDQLGFLDRSTKKMKVYGDTVRNNVNISPYVDSLGDIIDTVIDEVDATIPGSLEDSSIAAKRQMSFEHVMNNILEQIGGSEDVARNAKNTIFMGDELNIIDFQTSLLFPGKYARTTGTGSEFTTLNLNRNDALLNLFYNEHYGNYKTTNKVGDAGFNSLVKAYDSITADSRFEGAFSLSRQDLFKYQEGHAGALNDIMMDDLRNFVSKQRTKDSAFGILNSRKTDDVLTANTNIAEIFKNNKEKFVGQIKQLAKEIPDTVDTLSTIEESSFNKIVEGYMLPFSKESYLKQLQGLPGFQKDIFERQYDIAKKESQATAKDLLFAVKESGSQLIMKKRPDGTTGLHLLRGNEMNELNLHKYSSTNGIMSYSLNGVEYVNRLALDGSRIATNKNPEYKGSLLQIKSSVQKATDRINITDRVKSAIKNGDDAYDTILRTISYKNKNLREETARISTHNGQAAIQAMMIDMNDIAYMLPELKRGGILDRAQKKLVGSNFDENALKSVSTLVNRILKDPYKNRIESLEDMMATDRNYLMMDYMGAIVNTLAEDASDPFVKKVLAATSMRSKNTQLNKGLFSVGSFYLDPLAAYDQESRPPVVQMANTHLYNKEDLKKAINKSDKDIVKSLELDPIITNDLSKKFLHNVKSETGTLTAGLSTKYLQINSNNLREIFTKDVNRTASIFTKQATESLGVTGKDALNVSKVLTEKAMMLSSYEQQAAMDARIHDIGFHTTNSKLIDAKKAVVINHTDNIKTIETVKKLPKLKLNISEDGKVSYELGVKVNAGDFLAAVETVKGEAGQDISARNKGVFRLRYFDKYDQMISEEKLNKVVSASGLTAEADILNLLNSKFNPKYQLLNQAEPHGHKIFVGPSEKATVDSLKIATGSLDKTIQDTFKELGLHDELNVVHTKDYLDQYIKPILDRNNKSEVYNRILKERYLFSDAIHNFDELKDIGVIANLDVIKHQSASIGLANDLHKLRQANNGVFNEDELSRIFGKDNFSLIDPSSIHITDTEDMSKNINVNELQAILKEKGITNSDYVKLSGTDKVIGHTGTAHVYHAYDDEAGTFAGDLNKRDIELKLLNETDPVKREALEKELSSTGLYKGFKFSQRMNMNLDRTVYNKDYILNMKEKLSEEEFNKVAGHLLDAKGNIKEEYLGKSVLNPITSVLRDKLLTGEGDVRINDIHALNRNAQEKYKYLQDVYGKDSNYSIKRAEKMFSYGQGVRAMAFNENPTSDMLNKLTNLDGHYKFKEIGINDLQLDIGGQGGTIAHSPYNPYTNNVIINTGLSEAGYEQLAIGRTPELHYKDSLIKESHVQKLGALQTQIKLMNENGITQDEKDARTRQVKKTIDDIKALQKKDITSKTGLYGQLNEVRVNQSFMGKASGLTITDANSYDELKSKNAKWLDTAMIGDKSILEHYSEGKVFDAFATSETAFRKMGYFNEDFLNKNLNGSNSFVKDYAKNNNISVEDVLSSKTHKEEVMKNILETQGDAFLGTRFPQIQEGSDKVMMGYLNRGLRDNQTLVLGPSGASANLDHDGDLFFATRAKNRNGQSMINYAMNKDNADKDLIDLVHAENFYMTERAVGENRFFDQQVKNKVTKEMEVALKGNSLQSIAEKNIIDGKIYTGLVNTEGLTVSDMEKMKSEFADIRATAANHTDAAKMIVDKYGEEGKDEALKRYATSVSYDNLREVTTAKVYNSAIGETNMTMHKVKMAINSMLDKSADDYQYRSNLVTDIFHRAEQGAISSKSSVEGLTADRARQWNSAVMDVMSGNQSRTKDMRKWLTDNVIDDVKPEYYYSNLPSFRDKFKKFNIQSAEHFSEALKNDAKFKEKVQNVLVDDIIDTISSVANREGMPEFINSLSLGNSAKGVSSARALSPTIASDAETTYNVIDDALNATVLKGDMKINRVIDDSVTVTKNAARASIDDVLSSAEDTISTKGITQSVIEGVGEAFRAGGGHSLAKGALGVAAAVMVAGFVGGKPPAPASTQAMETADEYPSTIPALYDQGMPVQSRSQNGYVININAKTDKGREHAISAIQSALTSGGNSNINISMNINDDNGNIDDRTIDQLIAGALKK